MKIFKKNIFAGVLTTGLLGLFSAPLHATLVVDGGFDDKKINNTSLLRKHIGVGWVAKAANKHRWIVSDGVAQASNGTWELAQVNTIDGETGSDLKFSFTWTAPSGASGGDLNLSYALVGWIGDKRKNQQDRALLGLNKGPGIQICRGQEDERPSIGVDAIDLTDGDREYTTQTVSGKAGSSQTFTFDYKLSNYAEDCNDLSDYNHVGIVFWRTSAKVEGGKLDDVNLSIISTP